MQSKLRVIITPILALLTLLIIVFSLTIRTTNTATAITYVKSKSIKLEAHSYIVGLGDSSITGYDCMCDNLLTEFANSVGTKTFDNYGVNGSTSNMLLGQLNNNEIQNNIKKSQSVLVVIGANDLNSVKESYVKNHINNINYNDAKIYDKTMNNIDAIIKKIALIHGSANFNINLIGYWNLFSDGSKAIKGDGYNEYLWSVNYTNKFNKDLLHIAKVNDVNFIDANELLKKYGNRDDYISEDGEHLNATGYKIIASNIPK